MVDMTVVDVEETADSIDFVDLVESLDASPVREICSGPTVSTFHLHLNQYYFVPKIPEKFSENRIIRLLSIIVETPFVPCRLCHAGSVSPASLKRGNTTYFKSFVYQNRITNRQWRSGEGATF
jgi:hypothetical protein